MKDECFQAGISGRQSTHRTMGDQAPEFSNARGEVGRPCVDLLCYVRVQACWASTFDRRWMLLALPWSSVGTL